MESPLPRFKRDSAVASFQLTKRDREMLRQVNRHRFLRSQQIASLVGGSHQQVLRRLQLLFHHGYLERPRCQLDYYYKGGSRTIVYGVGDKGAELLREKGIEVILSRPSEANNKITRIYLEHALSVSDVMVALELACRQRDNVTFLSKEQLQTSPFEFPSRWSVDADGRRLGIMPDRLFALEHPIGERAYFFLEADRGTMPVMRSGISQTSMFRKLLAYAATWKENIHKTQFGFHRFRALIVTNSPERLQSLVNACSRLEYGHNLFLFAHFGQLTEANILTLNLATGRAGEFSTLLE